MNQKSIATIGIWNLYADEKRQGVYHIEGFDKRCGKDFIYPFVRLEIERNIFNENHGEYVIYNMPRTAVSKKAYTTFIDVMLKQRKQQKEDQLKQDYAGNFDFLRSIGAAFRNET